MRQMACKHWLCYQCYNKASELENANCTQCTVYLDGQFSTKESNYLRPLYTGSPDTHCTHCLGFGHSRETSPECALNIPPNDDHTYHPIGHSTKFQAALVTLDYWRRLDKMNEDKSPYKVVIFSQWVSSFNLLQPVLEQNGYSTLRFTGETINLEERNKILEQFANDHTIHILLCGLKVGGVGLDLVSANRCIMLEPWFNLPVEKQAADRTHRIGQTRPVHIVKFTIKYSVEDWMLALQTKKQAESEWIKGEWKIAKQKAKQSSQFNQKDLASLLYYLCRSYYNDHRPL